MDYLLALTSNPGAKDFEMLRIDQEYLFERILKTATLWGSPENLMFVIGATQTQMIRQIRKITPKYFYLVPGVGAQGGNIQEISASAIIDDVGLLVNVSRSVIYASGGKDFAVSAGNAAHSYQQETKREKTDLWDWSIIHFYCNSFSIARMIYFLFSSVKTPPDKQLSLLIVL
jgi:orotidine-5'-phosphate decarboxylase